MTDPIEDFVKRSIVTYKEGGDYRKIFGASIMKFLKSGTVDEVAQEMLGNSTYLKAWQTAFRDYPPQDGETYVVALEGFIVVTNQRIFQLDEDKLLRAPIPLFEVDTYELSGFWFFKREVIILINGERIERKAFAVSDPAELVMTFTERAKAEHSRRLRIEALAILPLSLQRLFFSRILQRVEELLETHAEKSRLTWTQQFVSRSRAFLDQRIGTLPSDADIPELTADDRVLQMMDPREARTQALWVANAGLLKGIVHFDAVDPPGGPAADLIERAEGLLNALDDIVGACAKLDPVASASIEVAITSDRVAALQQGPTAGWSDDSMFTEDPLGPLWPDGYEAVQHALQESTKLASLDGQAIIFVFDYDGMSGTYGTDIFEVIDDALVKSKGVCAFVDGDLEVAAGGIDRVPGLLKEIRDNGWVINSRKGDSALVQLVVLDRLHAYAVGMWTNNLENVGVLDERLVGEYPGAYLGYLQHPKSIDHAKFYEIFRPLQLPVRITYKDGRKLRR